MQRIPCIRDLQELLAGDTLLLEERRVAFELPDAPEPFHALVGRVTPVHTRAVSDDGQ